MTSDGDLIQDSLSEVIDNEYGGGMLTNYYVIAEYIDSDGDRSWFSRGAEGQSQIVTLGLLGFASRALDHEVDHYLHRNLCEEDEDD